MYSHGGPEPSNRFPFVAPGKILVEKFAAVGEPEPRLGEMVGRQAVVVNLDVDLAAVQRAADKRDVNAFHNPIFRDAAEVRGGSA